MQYVIITLRICGYVKLILTDWDLEEGSPGSTRSPTGSCFRDYLPRNGKSSCSRVQP